MVTMYKGRLTETLFVLVHVCIFKARNCVIYLNWDGDGGGDLTGRISFYNLDSTTFFLKETGLLPVHISLLNHREARAEYVLPPR